MVPRPIESAHLTWSTAGNSSATNDRKAGAQGRPSQVRPQMKVVQLRRRVPCPRKVMPVSRQVAIPWPPPMHSQTTAFAWPRRCNACATFVLRIAPGAPTLCRFARYHCHAAHSTPPGADRAPVESATTMLQRSNFSAIMRSSPSISGLGDGFECPLDAGFFLPVPLLSHCRLAIDPAARCGKRHARQEQGRFGL